VSKLSAEDQKAVTVFKKKWDDLLLEIGKAPLSNDAYLEVLSEVEDSVSMAIEARAEEIAESEGNSP
jgi:hypothetical protein